MDTEKRGSSELSAQQKEKAANITLTALMWGGVTGLVGGVLLFLILGEGGLGGFAPPVVVLAGLGVGWIVFHVVRTARAAKMICRHCGASYALGLVDRDEQLVSAVPRHQQTLVAKSGPSETPRYRHESWVDEKYFVTEVYECSSCGDQTTREFYQTGRAGYQSSTDW